MSIKAHRWLMTAVNTPLERADFDAVAGPGEVVVAVAGCGVCHTDLGYFYDGVRTNSALPLALGHEVSGRVVAAGAGAEAWMGKAVIVPAVLPCGECDLCQRGLGTICRAQKMPGNDIQGGFASHIVVPGRGLCEVDEARLANGRADAGRGLDRRRRADHALPGGAPRRRDAGQPGHRDRRRRRRRLLRAGGRGLRRHGGGDRRRRRQARGHRRAWRGADAQQPQHRRQGDQGRDRRLRQGAGPAHAPSGSSSSARAPRPGSSPPTACWCMAPRCRWSASRWTRSRCGCPT